LTDYVVYYFFEGPVTGGIRENETPSPVSARMRILLKDEIPIHGAVILLLG